MSTETLFQECNKKKFVLKRDLTMYITWNSTVLSRLIIRLLTISIVHLLCTLFSLVIYIIYHTSSFTFTNTIVYNWIFIISVCYKHGHY